MRMAIPTEVLLVDDNEVVLQTLRAMLESPDRTLVYARSGAQALELAAYHDFAVLLVDIHMPEMDGFSFVQAVRDRGSDVPIVYVTGSEPALARMDEVYQNGVDLLRKPVDPAALRAKVEVYERLYLGRYEVQRTHHYYESIIEHMGNCLLVFDAQGIVTRTNRATCELLGLARSDLLGRRADELFEGDGEWLREQLFGKSPTAGFLRMRGPSGEPIPVHTEGCTLQDAHYDERRIVTVSRDMRSEKRMQALQRAQLELMTRLAHTDSLTNVASRNSFWERLEHMAERTRRSRGQMGLVLCDIDGFKELNDYFGHGVGDFVLVELARRFSEAMRDEDMVARVGGDEFAVLAEGPIDENGVARVLTRLLDLVRQPIQCDQDVLHVHVSFGVVLWHGDEKSADLFRRADLALYQAKEAGGDNWKLFTPQLAAGYDSIVGQQNRLRQALEKREFQLHYQPIVAAESRCTVAAEALIRWYPTGSIPIYPTDFVSVLERIGLIIDVGEWVLLEALRERQRWREHGRDLAVSINLSARQLGEPQFADRFAGLIREHSGSGEGLTLEITESMLMQDMANARARLNILKDVGCGIAIDDFGTGYSSLAYLRSLPVDTLKIDRSFVSDLPGREDDAAIARAIIALAHSLGLRVVAEGVETEAQYAFMREAHCDLIQGYLISRPMDGDSFSAWRDNPSA
jgi:diguanylate cyclase (GGDEF)-like protein/PAS domain S-box-containing protein